MNNERNLAQNMRAELKRNGIFASLKDYENRRNHLIDLNDGFHDVLDFIPDFIMIDLLKEYEYSFSYKNIDEFAEGILGYKHGSVQRMRKIAKHFFILNPHTKEFELDKDFMNYDPTKLEPMAKWSKQELLAADINPSMTVYEIDAKVRENGLKTCTRITEDENRILKAYRIADDTIKDQIKTLLKLQ